MSQIQESEGGNSVSRGPSFPLAAMFVISLVASVMAAAGFYLARRGFIALSIEITDDDVDDALEAAEQAVAF